MRPEWVAQSLGAAVERERRTQLSQSRGYGHIAVHRSDPFSEHRCVVSVRAGHHGGSDQVPELVGLFFHAGSAPLRPRHFCQRSQLSTAATTCASTGGFDLAFRRFFVSPIQETPSMWWWPSSSMLAKMACKLRRAGCSSSLVNRGFPQARRSACSRSPIGLHRFPNRLTLPDHSPRPFHLPGGRGAVDQSPAGQGKVVPTVASNSEHPVTTSPHHSPRSRTGSTTESSADDCKVWSPTFQIRSSISSCRER